MPARNPAKICIVSAELNRLFRNGGIGTACTGLAQLLAEQGHEVTVSYTAEVPASEQTDFQASVDFYLRELGIRIRPLRTSPRLAPDARGFAARALSVHDQLREQEWDAVFFNDVRAEGFYAVMAKRAGLAYRDTALCVVAHGPRTWVRELNHWRLQNGDDLENVFMERATARFADHLISPSRYMLEWLAGDGWRLPSSARVTKVRLPRWRDPATSPALAPRQPARELVFFGRLEYRKGLTVFCDAVEELAATHPDLRITFLGKFGDIMGEHAGSYVLRRARAWPFELRFVPRLGQREALDYLRRRPDALPVMPSLVDNLPCVVAECLREGLPFLATDTGGIAELVAPEDHAHCLCAPTSAALADAIRPWLDRAPSASRPADTAQEVDAAWLATLDDVLARRTASPWPKAALEPTVPAFVVAETIDPATARSLAQQTNVAVEVKTVSTAGDLRAALASADAERVLWIRNGAVLDPGAVEQLLRSAVHTAADVTTCLEHGRAGSQIQHLSLGNAREAAYCRNVFGDGVALVRKDALVGAGLLEDEAFGHDMWSSWCEASFADLRIFCVPAPLARAAAASRPDPGAGEGPHEGVRAVFERHQYRECPLLFDLLDTHVPRAHGPSRPVADDPVLEQLARVPPDSDQALALLASYATRTQRFSTAFELHALINAERTRPRTFLPVRPMLGPEATGKAQEWEVTITRADMHAFALSRDCVEVQDEHPFSLVRVDEQTPALQVHPVTGREVSAELPLGKAEHLREVRAHAFLGSPDAPAVEFQLALVSAYARLVVAATPWTRVDQPGSRAPLSLSLPALDAGDYDLALSTRLPGDRMSYAHARFADIHLVFGRPETTAPDDGSPPRDT